MEEEILRKIRELPSNWWTQASRIGTLLTLFRNYVVALLIGGRSKNEYQYSVFSGFLVEHEGNLLWFTAGHVVEEIERILQSESFSFEIARWLDYHENPEAGAVPAEISRLEMRSWKTQGLDFGVIRISGLQAFTILHNEGIRVFNELVWHNLENASPEGYLAIGYPREWNSYSSREVADNKVLRAVKADMACIPLGKIPVPEQPTNSSFWDPPDAFFGKIIDYPDAPDLSLDSIRGMSGGPLLSIERDDDGRLRYRLVGVVSRWLPSDEIVRAEPIARISKALDQWL